MCRAAALGLALACAGQAAADEIRLAVASNFGEAVKAMAERFEARTGHRVTFSFGSTGKHYAQIKNGAPFDAFFAADAERPRLLEQEGVARPGSRFTYALGRLVLWSPQPGLVDGEGRVLAQGGFARLAIANPRLAPYGAAAQQTMQAQGVWDGVQRRLVRGEDIGQTFSFVRSGNAALGFVAYSQVQRPGQPVEGSLWEVPQALYTPIEQQAVLLSDKAAARDFLAFARSEEAREILRGYGYGVP